MRILVTGGCGYKGSVLVPKLLAAGHHVTVLDTQWFGNHLAMHPALDFCVDDIRRIHRGQFEQLQLSKYAAIIHLAGIANDPCGELDAKLTWEVNVLAHMQLCDAAVRAGVSQFIYASSASVYGLKGVEEITEGMTLEPVSDYNKTKMCAERILLSYSDRMIVQIVRSATVCGMSSRMRLDTMVNMLTVQALRDGKITAHCGEYGGGLMRPNTHIEDITDLYCWLLEHTEVRGVMNAGFENISALDTARLIQRQVPCEIEVTTVKDKRSYQVNSELLLGYGFRPQHSVHEAVRDIRMAWEKGFRDRPEHVNLSWMRSHGLVGDHG